MGLPLDVIVGSPEERTRTTGALDYVDSLRERLARAHEFARQHLRKAQSYQKQQYDRRAQGAGFEPGQAVWLFTPKKKVGRTPKLQRWWEGPFAVLQRINDVTYKIQRTARAKPQIVHRNRLKSYKGDVQLEWWERAAHGAPAEEEPVRGERQGARGSDPRASPPGPPPSVGGGAGREPVEEAEPELPGQSGGVLGGEDPVVDGGGVPTEPARSEPEEGAST